MSGERNIRAAIIGGSESGKSYLAMGYSRGFWRYQKMRSLVFYPWLRERQRKNRKPLVWGPQAWVTDDFAQWKRVVCSIEDCCVIWDEASGNGGRDSDNVSLFTEIRHRHPVLFCIGHFHASILPGMRVNLTDLYLAQADPDDAYDWSRTMKDPAIRDRAQGLKQYQFLHKAPFRPVDVRACTEAELEAGILP